MIEQTKNILRSRLSKSTIQKLKKVWLLFGLVSYFDIKKRSKLDYFDYEAIHTLPRLYPIKYMQNMSYGLYRVISNFDPNFNIHNSTIEHGLYLGDVALKFDLEDGVKHIYTFSKHRESIIRSSNFPASKSVKIHLVGPYIKYAKNFHSEDKRNEIKRIYGRILLVFPFHSNEYEKSKFDNGLFISKIEEMKKDYDSVFVCVYCKDIEHQLHHAYIQKGYIIVSAGNDPYFLSRLKDLIELSDMTISNGIGTHIGYCICLNKPHYMFEQKIVTEKTVENAWENENGKIDEESYKYKLEKNSRLLFNTFNSTQPQITDDQINVVKHFWGDF